MVQEKTTAIGCAALNHKKYDEYDGHLYFQTYLVCNYSYTNMIDEPVYNFAPVGKESASGCQTGADNIYKGLCALAEIIESKQDPPDLSTYRKEITVTYKYFTLDGREFESEAEILLLNVPYRVFITTKTTYIPPI